MYFLTRCSLVSNFCFLFFIKFIWFQVIQWCWCSRFTLIAPCKIITIKIHAYGTVIYQVVKTHTVASWVMAPHVLVTGANIWRNILSLSCIKCKHPLSQGSCLMFSYWGRILNVKYVPNFLTNFDCLPAKSMSQDSVDVLCNLDSCAVPKCRWNRNIKWLLNKHNWRV